MWKFIVDVVHDFVSSLQPDVGRGFLHISNVFLYLMCLPQCVKRILRSLQWPCMSMLKSDSTEIYNCYLWDSCWLSPWIESGNCLALTLKFTQFQCHVANIHQLSNWLTPNTVTNYDQPIGKDGNLWISQSLLGTPLHVCHAPYFDRNEAHNMSLFLDK